MRRYWIERQFIQENEVEISGPSFHHICDVCRMDVGSRFEVLHEKAYLVEIVEKGKKKALAKILEVREVAELPKPWIHLALSLPRYATIDNVVEKSVELGVKSLQPFVSDFSFVSRVEKIPPSKPERWRKIVRSATQQSGRGELMEVRSPVHLKEMLKSFNQESHKKGLFLYEGEASKDLRSALNSLKTGPSYEDLTLFVGGEGGFSDAEVELFRARGLEPITLGPQVLRVETACMAIVSIIKYELDQMKL